MRGSNKLIKFTSLLLLLFFSAVYTFAQSPTQTIRGTIVDMDTEKTLTGSTIELLNADLSKGTTTDEKGNFRFDEIIVGRYQLKVSYIGYSTLFITDVLLESGKETVLELKLQQSDAELSEVVVKGKRISAERISPTGSYTLDPGRNPSFSGYFL